MTNHSYLTLLRSRVLLSALLLSGMLIATGCQNLGMLSSSSSANTSDTPTKYPPTPELFSEALPSEASVDEQLTSAVMPPKPSDPTQLMQQAGVPDTPPPGAAQSLGLIVCDPSPSAGLETFGSGCGRWLDLVASGQPELGRTPSWQSRARAQQELARKDFCLTSQQAASLRGMTGVTHVACGTIIGTPSSAVLTYAVFRLPSRTMVGKPIVVSGSEDNIIATLPKVARSIDAALGVISPHEPTNVGLTPTELTQVQTIGNETYQSDADLQILTQLSSKCPLAGMYWLVSRASSDSILHRAVTKTIISQLPGNPIPIYQAAFQDAKALWPFANQITPLLQRYSANALLAHTEVWQQRAWGNRAGEWRAARRFLDDAPGDPDAWLCIGSTVSNVAEDLRQGKFADDISPAENSVLNTLYPLNEKADLRATSLDPLDGHAWHNLAASATFQSDNLTAKLAMDNAITLDPNKEEAYEWGLEMDQPKWGVDPSSLNKIAQMAASQAWKSGSDAADISNELSSADFKAEAAQVLSDFITRQRAAVTTHPTDPMAHEDLATALADQHTPSSLLEATYEFRIAEHLMPGSSDIHMNLATLLGLREMTQAEIPEYKLEIADDPFDSNAHVQLGYDYKIESKLTDALREITIGVRLDPKNGGAHYALAELMAKQKMYDQAITECREAVQLNYFDIHARVELCWLLDNQHQSDAAIQAGTDAEHVLTENPDNDAELGTTLHSSIADAYLQKKQWSNSIDESNQDLAVSPDSSVSHENLAEAYFGEGKKAEARSEWQKTVALGDPFMSSVAQKFLANNP